MLNLVIRGLFLQCLTIRIIKKLVKLFGNSLNLQIKKHFGMIKNWLKKLLSYIYVGIGIYLLLCLTNWTWNLGEWNGFSRFIGGIIVFAMLINLFNLKKI